MDFIEHLTIDDDDNNEQKKVDASSLTGEA